MTALSVTAGYGEGTAYGKSVTDLQSDIVIAHGIVNGTLNYIDDYSDAFGEDEKSGHFLALKYDAPEDATVKTQLVGGKHGEVELPAEDRQCVYRITDKATQSIRVTVEKEGHKKERTYALSGLTLAAKVG